jgi:hypothetical protein
MPLSRRDFIAGTAFASAAVPYSTPDTPRRTNLREDRVSGDRLVLTGTVLATQLYFPGEAQNESDGIFDEALLMDVKGSRARYDFVLA